MTDDDHTARPNPIKERMHEIALRLGLVEPGAPWSKSVAIDLSPIIGIATRTLERWVSGARPMQPQVWQSIAVALRAYATPILTLADGLDAYATELGAPEASIQPGVLAENGTALEQHSEPDDDAA